MQKLRYHGGVRTRKFLGPMKNPPQILLVDDEQDFLEVLATKFKASGFDIVTASNGEEAVAKTKEVMPDLIVMDVKMPKMDGVQALLKLREDPTTAKVRVILLTAFGDPQPEIYTNDKRFAQELGAYEYFLKTQDLEEIVARVKASLAKAAA